MKKISILALAAIAAAFTAYRAFDDLAKSMESWEMDWEEEIDNE
ncbi:MAG: hypothetical protein RLZZ195_932 [Pseudomonadota bacterium]|jgi:hypothetical protein